LAYLRKRHRLAGRNPRREDREALKRLLPALRDRNLVWGGDWNQSLEGKDYAGSTGGLSHLLAAIDQLGLHVPTAALPHRIPGVCSVDHIAVPRAFQSYNACRVAAEVALSDHDLYTVEIP
jgi:hypothetical protein